MQAVVAQRGDSKGGGGVVKGGGVVRGGWGEGSTSSLTGIGSRWFEVLWNLECL